MCFSNPRKKAMQEGRLDGVRRIPGWDSTDPSPCVRALTHGAQDLVEKLIVRFEIADEQAKAEFSKQRDTRDQWEVRRGAAEKAHEKALDQYEQQHGTRPAFVKPASSLAYGLLMLLLLIGESPLNFVVFNVLALPIPLQLLLALIVGGAFVMSAHQLGKVLAEGPFRTWQLAGQFLACLVVPIATMAGMAVMREAYASAVQTAVNEANTGLVGVPRFDLSRPAVFWTFLFLNVLLYIVAVAYSHRVHDPLVQTASGLEHARRQTERAEVAARTARDRRIKLAFRHGAMCFAEQTRRDMLWSDYCVGNLRVRDIPTESQASVDPTRDRPRSHEIPPPPLWIPKCFKDPENELTW